MNRRGNNSILAELEWDEGLSMPVANADNKSLEDEVSFDFQLDRCFFSFFLFFFSFLFLFSSTFAVSVTASS